LIAYADTSFLVSLYGSDPNAAKAVHEFQHFQPTFLITPFNELEFVTAFEAIAFRGIATPSEVDATIRTFQADLASGVLRRHSAPANAFGEATSLSSRYTRTMGCRTLDILHVGMALALGVEVFFTFDKDQAKLARRVGLPVKPVR
jgi:predicted nucleic acid-binding protein